MSIASTRILPISKPATSWVESLVQEQTQAVLKLDLGLRSAERRTWGFYSQGYTAYRFIAAFTQTKAAEREALLEQ